MKKGLFRLASLILVLSLLLGGITVFATGDAASGGATDELPYIDHDTAIAEQTYDSIFTALSGDDAVAAGVPGGYSGYVLAVSGNTNAAYPGVCFDFTSQRIPIDTIEALIFRVYMPSGFSALRMRNEHATTGWVMNQSVTNDAWIDVTLGSDGTGFSSGMSFETIASDGYLSTFCLIGRQSSNKAFYIDSITVKLKAGATDDTTPPVITYGGASEITVFEGTSFTPTGISAYDEYDGAAASLSYEWSEDALTALGTLRLGTHVCTVRATDRSGNSSTIALTVNVISDPSVLVFDGAPYTEFDSSLADANSYKGTVTELSYTDAASAGVPEGYSGSVIKVEAGSNASYQGICLDFGDENIPVSIIESVSFRVYMTSHSELRMRNELKTSDWMMRFGVSSYLNSWIDVTLYSDGTNFFSGNLANMTNDEGSLGAFCLIGRLSSGSGVYYIDSVTVRFKEGVQDDPTPPVISYDGKTDILTSAGKPFVLNATAYDKLEDREIALDYDLPAGMVDSDGNLLEGEFTVTVSATDYFGNTSSITLNVTVGPVDTEAPEILFYAEDVYVLTGTFYRMEMLGLDNYDDVTVTESWSDGAVDEVGRLMAGEHTLTLTCIDLTGNQTVIVVRLHVLDTDTVVGVLILCGEESNG